MNKLDENANVMSSLYIIKNNVTGNIRIMISTDIDANLRILQLGNEHRLSVEYGTDPISNALELMDVINAIYTMSNLSNYNWYDVPIERMINSIEELIK